MTDTVEHTDDLPIEGRSNRRRMIRAAGMAAAGAAVGAAVTGQPASAADGGNMILGQLNTATSQTGLGSANATLATLGVLGAGGGAIYAEAISATKPAVIGRSAVSGGLGVRGEGGPNGVGLVGAITSGSGVGVWGEALTGGVGTRGSSISGVGVSGVADSGVGVTGSSSSGDGVRALSTSGTALSAKSEDSLGASIEGGQDGVVAKGARWAVKVDHVLGFEKRVIAPPATGTFASGDLIVSQNDGSMWVCVTGGTPGRWVKVAGQSTAGSRQQSGGCLPGGDRRRRPAGGVVGVVVPIDPGVHRGITDSDPVSSELHQLNRSPQTAGQRAWHVENGSARQPR